MQRAITLNPWSLFRGEDQSINKTDTFQAKPRFLTPFEYRYLSPEETKSVYAYYIFNIKSSSVSPSAALWRRFTTPLHRWRQEAIVWAKRLRRLPRLYYLYFSDVVRISGRWLYVVQAMRLVGGTSSAVNLYLVKRVLDLTQASFAGVPGAAEKTVLYAIAVVSASAAFELLFTLTLRADEYLSTSYTIEHQRRKLEIIASYGPDRLGKDESSDPDYVLYETFQPSVLSELAGQFMEVVSQSLMLWYQVDMTNALLVALNLCFAYIRDHLHHSHIPRAVFKANDAHLRMQQLDGLALNSGVQREIATLGMYHWMRAEFERQVERFGLKSLNFPNRQNSLSISSIICGNSRTIVYTVAALQAAYTGVSPFASAADLSYFSDALQTLNDEVESLSYTIEDFARMVDSLSNYMGLLATARAVEASRAKQVSYAQSKRLLGGVSDAPAEDGDLQSSLVPRDSPKGMTIEFCNVSFKYPGESTYALQNVSFKIGAGEVVAIVGPNGCGKSTLLTLMSRLKRPDSGKILINGVDLNDFDLRDLLAHMSFMHQTPNSLPVTVSDYLKLGSLTNNPEDTDLSKVDVSYALEASGAGDIIATLRDGWDTYVMGAEGARQNYGYDTLPRVNDYVPSAPIVVPIEDKYGEESWGLDASFDAGCEAFSDADCEFPNTDFDTSDAERTEGDDFVAVEKMVEETAEGETEMMPLVADAEKEMEPEIDGPTHEIELRDDAGNMYKVKYSAFSPDAVQVSGGQWQRLALAQAFMKRGKNDLFVFDEPAAALDPKSEFTLFKKILDLKNECTVLFSTHRFSITAKADKILMFSEGKLIEMGNHQELMAVEDGHYKEMWSLQANSFSTNSL